MSNLNKQRKFLFISELSASIAEVVSQFSEVIGRDDTINSIENSKIFVEREDKKKLSTAIDSLVLNEEEEGVVVLSSGEEMKVMI